MINYWLIALVLLIVLLTVFTFVFRYLILNYKNSIKELENNNSNLKNELQNEKFEKFKLESKCENLNELLEKLKDDRLESNKSLSNQFSILANKIFEEKSLSLNYQNSEKIKSLLDPFSENIKDLKKKVEDTYQSELRDRSSLQGELKKLFELNQTLSKEANNLSRALKGDQKTQGNWGEFILESILEKSGLRKGSEYLTQESHTDKEGNRQQPDVVILLPEDRKMIIDSKVSLVAFDRYVNDESLDVSKQAALDHVKSLRQHIQGLSSKSYHDIYPENHLDFVLLFVPIEPAFGAAMQIEPGLFQEAFNKNVLLVSPSTLLVTLKMVANLWRQEKQSKNALEIARQGGALYDKVLIVFKDLELMGKQLASVQGTFEKTMGGMVKGKGNLLSRTEKLKSLGAKTSKVMPVKTTEQSLTLVEPSAQDY